VPNLLDRLKTALSDRYAIEDELGAGGMATVYLAEDIKHPLTSWFPWALHGLRHHVGGRSHLYSLVHNGVAPLPLWRSRVP
jgi:hypothetical protein